jgi:L-cysteate sulfo-lyase
MPFNAAALEQRLAVFPRLGIAQLPTPLQPLHNLSAHLGGPKIWVKRDDLTGLGLGGNKLRKIDYALKAALDGGADCIVSGGVVQSNSQRQVAAACAKLGVPCHLAVFHGRVTPKSDRYSHSGNALLNTLFGAVKHDVSWDADPNAALDRIAQTLQNEGRRPAVLPYGISNAIGAIGYSSLCAELAHQCEAEAIAPKALVFASGSGGTHAGLALGADIALPDMTVIGFDIDAEPERVRRDVVRIVLDAAQKLDWTFDPAKIDLRAGMAGTGYGQPHPACLDALRLAGRLEALILDPTYSAKSLAGLIQMISDGEFTSNDTVIFVHTGGDAALFAYTSEQLFH